MKPTDFKTLGERIKYLRENILPGEEISQVEFGKIFKISHDAVSKYETNKAEPDVEFFTTLRQQYQVNINWLITGDGEVFSEQAPSKIQNLSLGRIAAELPRIYNMENRRIHAIIKLLESEGPAAQTIILHALEGKAGLRELATALCNLGYEALAAQFLEAKMAEGK